LRGEDSNIRLKLRLGDLRWELRYGLILRFWNLMPHHHKWYYGPNASRENCARCSKWK
jgi:hypothetical protein